MDKDQEGNQQASIPPSTPEPPPQPQPMPQPTTDQPARQPGLITPPPTPPEPPAPTGFQPEIIPPFMPEESAPYKKFPFFLIAVLVGVAFLALTGYFLFLKRPVTDETRVQMQKVTQFRHAFEIPADWYLEKREDFETTSGAKILIISPEPVTITSVNEGRFYRFNPILVADLSYRDDTQSTFQEFVNEIKNILQEPEVIEVETQESSPRSVMIRVEGIGLLEFNANKKVMLLLVFIPNREDASRGSTYGVDLTVASQSQFEEYKSIAKHIATTLIHPVSP